jgi:methionyl-tRNA synthetase
MVELSTDGLIPKPGASDASDSDLRGRAEELLESIKDKVETYKLNTAVEDMLELVRATNRYVEQNRPWDLGKSDPGGRLGTVLYNAAESLRLVALLLSPVMPEKCRQIQKQIGVADDNIVAAQFTWGGLKAGTKIQSGEALFPRLQRAQINVTLTADVKGTNMSQETPVNVVTFEEFGRIQMRAAKVVAAERVTGADKLLKLEIDLGDEKRQIVAGVAQHYAPEDLLGETLIVVTNLKPAKIRGIDSEGMLLAAQAGGKLVLLTTDKEIAPGAKIS